MVASRMRHCPAGDRCAGTRRPVARSRAGRWLGAALALAILLSGPTAARAAGQNAPQLPAELQIELLGKVLAFDRNIDRFKPRIRLGVLYQPENRESVRAFRAISAAAARLSPVEGLSFEAIPIELNGARLPPVMGTIDVLYLAPLWRVDPAPLVEAAAGAGVLTVTGVHEYVVTGVAVGFTERDRRARIIIDILAARRGGSDFRSQLLRLVEVRS